MKKLTGYVLSTFLLTGCATSKTNTSQVSSTEHYPPVHEILGLDEDIHYERKGAENHELVEATADDKTIAQEIGTEQIDDEDLTPKARISTGFLMKKQTKRTQFWVDYFTKGQRERFQRFINNGEEYRHHIEEIFASYGLPKELYFVGLIESGYYLGAKSHASAVGPWQFIKGTGKRYGLAINHELDERRDLFKASHAAARYFKDLYNIFSSWELALAAYNSGEYGVIRRIMKHGTRDYYLMSKNKQLPSETINYVPKVIAAMHIIQNAKEFGFDIPQKGKKVFDNTTLKEVSRNTSFDTLSKRLGIDSSVLSRLNPELNNNKTPRYYAGNYKLRVPQRHYSYVAPVSTVQIKNTVQRPESKKELSRRVATLPSTHTVRSGESLISIAKKYNTGAMDLAKINGFKTWKTKIRIGQKLNISESQISQITSTPKKVKKRTSPITYVVKSGDNLTTLAHVFNSNISDIKRKNKLKKNTLYVGQKLTIPGTKKGIYTVKKGDHLTLLSRNFNTPIEALIKINDLNKKTIYPGQKIIVNMD